MADVAYPIVGRASKITRQYAGFWRRALALVIDYVIVSVVVATLFVALGLAWPDIGRMVTLEAPLGFGTVERTIESRTTETPESDGSKIKTTHEIVEQVVFDRWVYRYRSEETVRVSDIGSYVLTVRGKTSQQIDPATGQDVSMAGVDDITLFMLMLYWIFADASRYQGSLGKRMLGLRVVGERGARLTLAKAAGRNLLKILSAVLLFIGFMMAGWTRRKQALHDKITDSFVVADP